MIYGRLKNVNTIIRYHKTLIRKKLYLPENILCTQHSLMNCIDVSIFSPYNNCVIYKVRQMKV